MSQSRTPNAIGADSPRGGLAVVVVAGGAATRLPGKLYATFGGLPLLERVVRNVAPTARELVIAGDVDAALAKRVGARVVADPQPGRGPLAGTLSAFDGLHEQFAFVVAGDAPFVDAAIVDALVAAWLDGDEAVVPVRVVDGARRLEPLAALYDVSAVRRHGPAALDSGGSMHALIDRLRARFVELDVAPHAFENVNTPEDFERATALLPPRSQIR